MKKTTSALLALVLVVSLAAPTFAFSAQLSAQNLAVDGQPIACEKYNIDGSNYFKLRDLAKLLDGTGSQFDVGWDGDRGVVSITTNHAYTTPNGTELVAGADQSATAQLSAQTIMIDGVVRTDLTVYNIGGNNFFKLREMGDALGFDVDYEEATNTATVASKGNTAPVVSPTPAHTETAGERNALASAKDYLRVMAFSYSSLVKQLEYEGYTNEEAVYGADNCGADWYEQALKSAKEYLRVMAFSYSGIIKQLEFEGFSNEEAKYGADNCEADWNEQAVKSAREYLRTMSFSRSGLISQLIFEGFTQSQAEYGVSVAYDE